MVKYEKRSKGGKNCLVIIMVRNDKKNVKVWKGRSNWVGLQVQVSSGNSSVWTVQLDQVQSDKLTCVRVI